MKKWHGARLYDPPTRGEATPLHNVESFTQFLHELWSLQEIIAVISIAHDDIFPSGCQNSTHKGTAVSFLCHVDQAGAELRCDRLTPIRASIIGNDDLSWYVVFI